jgi:hypothetical protein
MSLTAKLSRRSTANNSSRNEGDTKDKIVLKITSKFRKGTAKRNIKCNLPKST